MGMSSAFDKETEIMVPCVVGFYSRKGYNCWRQEDGQLTECLYEAGNSPYDSTTIVPMDRGLTIQTMRDYCETTGKEIAEEQGLEWIGCSEEDDGE